LVAMTSVFVPREAIWSFTKLRNPAPADNTKMTVEIPMTMPSVVRVVRTGFEDSDFVDCRNAVNIENAD